MIKQYNYQIGQLPYEYEEWTPEMGAFMERMNSKAQKIGMTSSHFENPYGGMAFGWNTTNCLDLIRLGIHAYSHRQIMDVLSLKGTANIHIYGEHERDVAITADMQANLDQAYERVHGPGKNPYIMYAWKGGGWDEGPHLVFCTLGFCRVEGKNVVVVTSNVSAELAVGRIYRMNAMIETLDICAKVLRGESVEGMSATYCDYAAAALLPEDTSSVLVKNRPLDLLYTQKADVIFNPASTSKVLAAITAEDIWGSNQELYQILDIDTCNDSDYWAFPGDIESIESGLYPILIDSNGSNTLALARHCGQKILDEKAKFGL